MNCIVDLGEHPFISKKDEMQDFCTLDVFDSFMITGKCYLLEEDTFFYQDIFDIFLNITRGVCHIEEYVYQDDGGYDILDHLIHTYLKGICLIDNPHFELPPSPHQDIFDILYLLMRPGTYCMIEPDEELDIRHFDSMVKRYRERDTPTDIIDIILNTFYHTTLIEDEPFYDPPDVYETILILMRQLNIHYCWIDQSPPSYEIEPIQQIKDIEKMEEEAFQYNLKQNNDLTLQNPPPPKNHILFLATNLKYLEGLIQYYSNYNKQYKIILTNSIEKIKKIDLTPYDILFCEFCMEGALYLSHHKLPYQKLIIRLHKHEWFKPYFYRLKWDSVYRLLVIQKTCLTLQPFLLGINVSRQKLKNYIDTRPYSYSSKSLMVQDLYQTHFSLPSKTIGIFCASSIIKTIEDKMAYVPNHIPHFTLLSRLSSNTSYWDLGIIGYHRPEKGFDRCLELLRRLLKHDSRYHLHIIGKPYRYKDNIYQNMQSLSKHITIYPYTEDNTSMIKYLQNIGIILSCSYIEGSHQAIIESIIAGRFPIIHQWFFGGAEQQYPEVYQELDNMVERVLELKKKNIPLDKYRHNYISRYYRWNIPNKFHRLLSGNNYPSNNNVLRYMKWSCPYDISYCQNQLTKNIFPKPNHFKVDIYFYQKVNRLEHLSYEEAYLHLIKRGISLGLIYHPQQLINLLDQLEISIQLQHQKFTIQFANHPPQCLIHYVSHHTYPITYYKHINDITNYSFHLNPSPLLLIVFIGYLNIGKQLIEKIYQYSKLQSFALAICFRDRKLLDIHESYISTHFSNYAIYLSKEYGNDIIPSLQVFHHLHHHPTFHFDYVTKVQTKNEPRLFECATQFLLTRSLKTLKKLKNDESNCVGPPGFIQSPKTGELYPNQYLIDKYKKHLDKSKKYVITTNFFCHKIVFERILEFIKENNYRGYFLNNMYDNNMINYFNSPPHFLERLFGMIHLK